MTDARGSEEARLLREFQAALLPPRCASCGHAEVAAAFRPATGAVGGDFHDAVRRGDREAYIIGDVTGHGPAAALVMAVLFGAVSEALRCLDHPAEVLEHLHDLLAMLGERAGGPRLFSATLFVGLLDADGGFTYANAGHPAPHLLREGEAPEALGAITPPLGLVEPTPCAEATVRLRPGDRLFAYTDGLLGPDAETAADLVARVLAMGSAAPEDIVESLVQHGADDDRTAVMVVHRGPPRAD